MVILVASVARGGRGRRARGERRPRGARPRTLLARHVDQPARACASTRRRARRQARRPRRARERRPPRRRGRDAHDHGRRPTPDAFARATAAPRDARRPGRPRRRHGAGQAAKLCNNLVAGATMAALAEACAIAVAEGIDPATLYELLTASTGDSACCGRGSRSPAPTTPIPSSIGLRTALRTRPDREGSGARPRPRR